MTGTITRAFLPRGFCFVRGDDGVDYFLQAQALDGEWEGGKVRQGARVEFDPEPAEPNPRAVRARLAA
jgi:cold shock CspA family protein